MHFLSAITSALLLGGAAAQQDMTGTTSGGAASGKTVNVHVVTVSNSTGKKLMFSPDNVQAAAGDMVQFQFAGGNHTVTQSTFANPCVPIQNIMSNTTGFFSGFQFVQPGSTAMPTYTLMVNNTSPIWFYCSQGKHCQSGMVGAINAAQTGAKTLAAYAALAANATQNLFPGEGSSGSSSSSGGSNSTSTGSGSGSSSSSGASPVSPSAPAGTSPAPPVSTGGASGSTWASSKGFYTSASVAGFVASIIMML
ncbi:MAG: hypothetical protein LQ340_007711 [Diploschistes diacapsis]|nr:MAG: hypothetical protein LQ340_007711 [Diploschistes diacapsis]